MTFFVRFQSGFFFTIFVTLLAYSNTCPARADQLTDPKVKEILTLINKSITDLAGRSETEAAQVCERVVSSIMDIDAVAKGGSVRIWEQMTPAQRSAYGKAAQRWAVRNCVRRNKDGNGTPVKFAGLRRGEGGDKLLATRSEQPTHLVIWRLRGTSTLRAVDLLLDGLSMTLQLRDETNMLLDQNNNDIDKAIIALHR